MTHKDMFKGMTYKSLDKQVDGTHYKGFKIEPAQFISENNLEWAEGEAIKYICALPCPKIFQNAQYDVGRLEQEGFKVQGEIILNE